MSDFKVKIRVEGNPNHVYKRLKNKIPFEELQKRLAQFALLRIRQHAPSRSGRLRKSFYLRKTAKGYMVASNSPYAYIVNHGGILETGGRKMTLPLPGTTKSAYPTRGKNLGIRRNILFDRRQPVFHLRNFVVMPKSGYQEKTWDETFDASYYLTMKHVNAAVRSAKTAGQLGVKIYE